MLDVSLPIELVTMDVLVGLYAVGKTASDPEIVVESILGLVDHRVAAELRSAMSS